MVIKTFKTNQPAKKTAMRKKKCIIDKNGSNATFLELITNTTEQRCNDTSVRR